MADEVIEDKGVRFRFTKLTCACQIAHVCPPIPSKSLPQDWGSLPKDILQCVFDQLFAADADTPWPLDDAHRQVATLRRVCKHFAEALAERPPELHLVAGNAPPHVLSSWIPAFPVASLSLCQYFDLERLQLGERSEVLAARWSVDCVSFLQPTQAQEPPALRIGALRSLRHLELDCPEMWRDGVVFTASSLSSLSNLVSLKAVGFSDFDLSGLPAAVADLTLGYGEVYVQDVLSSHSISMPRLPPGVSLDRLRIEKPGVVGIALDELTGCCRRVEVDALFCLAGVPVCGVGVPGEASPDIVTFFERPYREGAYVPPHILGDWEAVEASNRAADSTADYFLTGIAHSSMLESIVFSGKAATSVKMVPGRTGDLRRAVLFLHGVVNHATLFLFGMSGAELLDRALDLQGAGKLASEALAVTVEEAAGKDGFEIEVRHRMKGRTVGECDQGEGEAAAEEH